MTLPIGAECDGCNQYHGQLENSLLSHNRIGPVIMFRGIKGPDGPRKQIGHIKRDRATGDITITQVIKDATWEPGHLHLQLPTIRELDPLAFKRALYHIGFNHFAMLHGVPAALSSRFDSVRRFVRYGEHPNTWYYGQFCYPDEEHRKELGVHTIRWAPGIVLQIKTYLDDFYVELTHEIDFPMWVESSLPRGVGLL